MCSLVCVVLCEIKPAALQAQLMVESVQLQLLAIEGAIGALLHPLAQDNHATVAGNSDVACHMQVSENVGIHIAMRGGMLLHKILEVRHALFHPLIDLLLRTARAVVRTPQVGKAIGPARVHRLIKHLAHLIVKAPPHEAVDRWLIPDIVAM